jgi:hypothetical protein
MNRDMGTEKGNNEPHESSRIENASCDYDVDDGLIFQPRLLS